MENQNLVLNCVLCEQHSLHIMGEGETQTQQCIHCGYVTSERFKLNGKSKEDNEQYKKLPKDMQQWVVEKNDRIWIPTMLTLPTGMLYPTKDKDKGLVWSFAKMITISEDERKNYPVEGFEDKFYEQMFDTENSKIYDTFFEAMLQVYEKGKDGEKKGIDLPKIK